MNKKVLISGGIILMVVLLGFTFYKKVYLPKATFETVKLQQGDFSVWLRGIGELDAQFIYNLGFPITGRVMKIDVDQGDKVSYKQLLAKLDDTELKASLEEAQAVHAKTQLEIASTRREIELNQEQYNLSNITFQRYKKMLKGGNVSQEKFDQANSSMLTSKITLENAKIKLALSKSEALRVEKSLEVIKAKLHYTQLHSPVSGLIIERAVEKGQSVAAAQTVLKVLDPASLWVRAYIDERISGRLKVGETAKITLRSKPNTTYIGTVKRIDFQSDQVTQEHVVYIAFNNPLKTFHLNEQAEVRILAQTLPNIKSLPIDTLATYHKELGVWVNRDSEAFFVPLHVLEIADERFAFEGEITKNDRVLIMNKKKKPLFDGVNIAS
ncbi:efflux RND transporter periplasmic adaptor subunit [Thiomicrorhabdus hydrogeniphila]